MSFILQGSGVSEGIAIGHAHLAAPAALEVMHYLIPKHQVDKEIARLDSAFAVVRKEFEALQKAVADGHARAEFSAFLDRCSRMPYNRRLTQQRDPENT